jgi:hypothetical protein
MLKTNKNKKVTTFVARMASTLALSLALASVGTLSASAYGGHTGLSPRGTPHMQSSVQQASPRYFGYAGPVRRNWMLVPNLNLGATDAPCYLPTDRCDNYLSN